MKKHWMFMAVVVALALPSQGCRFLSKMMKGNSKKQMAAEMKALEDKGDVATLRKLCDSTSKDKTANRKQKLACGSYIRANIARLKKNPQCDSIRNEYEYMYYKAANWAYPRRSVKWMAYNEGGILLARCKKWDFLFSAGLYGGGSRSGGMKLLSKIEKAGHPVEQEYVRWLGEQETPFRGQSKVGGRPLVNGHIPAMQASLWLRNKRSFGHCKTFAKAANRSPAHIQSSFIEYMYHAKCKQLRPLLLKRLAHDRWQVRSNACILLGKVGQSSDLRKISIVRSNDSNLRVRLKCAGAISKIKVRG